MEKIKFNNHEKYYSVHINSCVYNNTKMYTVIFENEMPKTKILASGFKLVNEHNYNLQGDFSDAIYIRDIDRENNYVTLANKNDELWWMKKYII